MKIVRSQTVVRRGEPSTEKEVKSPSGRVKVKTVRRKRKVDRLPSRKFVTPDSSQSKAADDLVDFWDEVFEQASGGLVDEETRTRKLRFAADILSDIGVEAARRCVRILLTDPRAAWVNNKTLEWLTRASNRKYITSYAIKKRTAKAAEYKNRVSGEVRFTFKR